MYKEVGYGAALGFGHKLLGVNETGSQPKETGTRLGKAGTVI